MGGHSNWDDLKTRRMAEPGAREAHETAQTLHKENARLRERLKTLADLAEEDAPKVAGNRAATLDTLYALARRARRAAEQD